MAALLPSSASGLVEFGVSTLHATYDFAVYQLHPAWQALIAFVLVIAYFWPPIVFFFFGIFLDEVYMRMKIKLGYEVPYVSPLIECLEFIDSELDRLGDFITWLQPSGLTVLASFLTLSGSVTYYFSGNWFMAVVIMSSHIFFLCCEDLLSRALSRFGWGWETQLCGDTCSVLHCWTSEEGKARMAETIKKWARAKEAKLEEAAKPEEAKPEEAKLAAVVEEEVMKPVMDKEGARERLIASKATECPSSEVETDAKDSSAESLQL